MRVLLFAGLAEAAGQRELALDEVPDNVDQLLQELQSAYPELPWSGVRVAVNQRYVALEHALQAHDEIALIPPVSGG